MFQLNDQVRVLCRQAMQLCDQLINLCNHPVPNKGQVSFSINNDFAVLRRMMPCEIMVPLEATLTVNLPGKKLNQSSLSSYKPFMDTLPTIKAFEDHVAVMSSLQRPRRIGMIATDGRVYHFLCKPKDDLRKDCRAMEFYSMINKLLKRNTESRSRHLKIRTYAVIPLHEECGLIEWVPNTNTMRSILSRLYKNRNVTISVGKLREWKEAASDPKKATDYFLSQLLKPHQPAVFHHWFIESFADPNLWLVARTKWARTLAVMSIVGFVVGLGDRHTENVLIDETTGDAVHVDFNCLFEKGLTFDFPERVPFRLTHNMVDGFGVTGVEGSYRKCCEVTMRLVRNHKNTLMSVMETFVHDPLLEWSKKSSKSSNARPMDVRQAYEQGKRVLQNIDNKLSGGMGLTYRYNLACEAQGANSNAAISVLASAAGSSTGSNIAHSSGGLSVEGQVRELISQATESSLLSKMWIGWSAYL